MKYTLIPATLAAVQALTRDDKIVTVDGTNVSVIEAYADAASKSNYDKVIVYLHGGGGSGDDIYAMFDAGIFGEDIDNIKFIFPSSTISGGV